MEIVYISNPSHDRFYCPVTGIPIFDDDDNTGVFEDAESVIAVFGSDSIDDPTIKSPEMKKAWEEYIGRLRSSVPSFENDFEKYLRSFLKKYNHFSAIVFSFQWSSPLGSNYLYYVIDWDLGE
jgi:hypothetical protein